MNPTKVKNDIVEKYGGEKTIGYYYYSRNPVEYVGEKQVRKSFDSVKQYGERVYIGDYSSTDNIKEIAEEYGFTFLTIEKTKGVFFHEPKIANKIINEMKENFMCYLNFWIYYPENLEEHLKGWLNRFNGKDYYLRMTGYASYQDGKLFKTNHKRASHSVCTLIYRPFLYEARGYDERTDYNAGIRNYAHGILTKVYKLKEDSHFFPFVHIFHSRPHIDKVPQDRRRKGFRIVDNMISDLSKNLYVNKKKIHNSYW